ncbi:MAG TPA: hypothetical protein VD864_08280 [Nocardioides sp.]|nr:hypothetical protein [Nocardioides sp.]
MTGPRDAATRKADTLAMWATPAIDVWVATASPEGVAHLVPVSLAWTEERLVVAVHEDSAPPATWTRPAAPVSRSVPPAT